MVRKYTYISSCILHLHNSSYFTSQKMMIGNHDAAVPLLHRLRLILAILVAATVVMATDKTKKPLHRHNKSHSRKHQKQVKTTLCSTYTPVPTCSGECKTYLTPLQSCYNAKFLFPNDESWSDVDIFDQLYFNTTLDENQLHRTFYKSNDGSCSSDVDYSWIQPFEVCEGPFGYPRPWGKFSLVDDIVVAENDVLLDSF